MAAFKKQSTLPGSLLGINETKYGLTSHQSVRVI